MDNSNMSINGEETYMQKIARYEFEEFEGVSDIFYEMIDSLHRLGDIDFLSNIKVDGSKLSNSNKVKEYIYEPYNMIKIMGDIERINVKMVELRERIEEFLYNVDRYNVTNPESKRKRQSERNRMDTIDAFIPLISMLSDIKNNEKDEIEEGEERDDNESYSLDEVIERDSNIRREEEGEREEVFRSRPRIPRNIVRSENRISDFSYFSNPIV